MLFRSDTLNGVFLITGEELGFITDLENVASKNNMKQIIDFDNSKYEITQDIKIIPLQLRLNGSLENLISYINSLEKLDYYIEINQIDINTSINKSKRKSSGLTMGNKKEGEGEIEGEEDVELSIKLDGLTYWK